MATVERGRTSTRDAVLDAALDVFTRHTFDGTPMTAVAEHARVAVGTIYRHFPSKEALGNAVYRQWKGRLLEYLTDADQPAAPVRVRFGRFWRALLAFADAYPTAFAFLEHQQHEGYLDAESQALSDRVNDIALSVVVLGQRTGEVRRGDPAVLIALVYGAFVGLSKAQRAGTPIGEAQLKAAEEAVWAMLEPHETASST